MRKPLGVTPERLFSLMERAKGDGVGIEAAMPACFRHRSRASFRRPQCLSFRDGSNARSTLRFKALMTPMRANIVGPPDVATRINASIAACYSSASCSDFGSRMM